MLTRVIFITEIVAKLHYGGSALIIENLAPIGRLQAWLYWLICSCLGEDLNRQSRIRFVCHSWWLLDLQLQLLYLVMIQDSFFLCYLFKLTWTFMCHMNCHTLLLRIAEAVSGSFLVDFRWANILISKIAGHIEVTSLSWACLFHVAGAQKGL